MIAVSMLASMAVMTSTAAPTRAAVPSMGPEATTVAPQARVSSRVVSAEKAHERASATPTGQPEWLFVQNSSQRGADLVLKKNGTGTLTVNADNPGIVAFTDRPFRQAKLISMFAFAKTWKQGADSFEKDPPNAMLSGQIFGAAHSIGLELTSIKSRKVGPTRWRTTYGVKLLHVAGDEAFEKKLPKVGAQINISHAALFIDGWFDWFDDVVNWVNDNIIQPIVKTAEEIIQDTINAVTWVVGQAQDLYSIASKFVNATIDQAKRWVASLGAAGVFDMLWHIISFLLGFVVPGPTLLKRMMFLFTNGVKVANTAGLGVDAGCFADFKGTTYCGSYLVSLVNQIYDNMPRPMLDWMVAKQNVADGLIKVTKVVSSLIGGTVCALGARSAAIDGVSKALAQLIVYGDGADSQRQARDYVSAGGIVSVAEGNCPLS